MSDDDINDDFSIEEIEAAYLRALETAEAAENLFPGETEHALPEQHAERLATDALAERTEPVSPDESQAEQERPLAHMTPLKVLEALLFVGGSPLPAKKLGEILGGSFTHERVDQLVEELNERYRSQFRPYEIRLVEGGYRMVLKPAYESVRRKVFGHGPKEVKLPQEALEILALIAYEQPVTKERAEETERKNIGGILRQLLRRELIELHRGDEDTYHTTPRFLELFGLQSIDDLPQPIDFSFK